MLMQVDAWVAVAMAGAAITPPAAGAAVGMGAGGIGRTVQMATGGTSPPGGYAPSGGMPRTGREIGRGAEGVVYENLDEPGWVVKEFHKGGTSPVQARNEFQNLEKARAIRPDNVIKAQVPADPRQGFLVKEEVFRSSTAPDMAQRAQLLRDFQNIPDAGTNLMWGTTVDNSTPRWILIE
jgi:hypothetical protein